MISSIRISSMGNDFISCEMKDVDNHPKWVGVYLGYSVSEITIHTVVFAPFACNLAMVAFNTLLEQSLWMHGYAYVGIRAYMA